MPRPRTLVAVCLALSAAASAAVRAQTDAPPASRRDAEGSPAAAPADQPAAVRPVETAPLVEDPVRARAVSAFVQARREHTAFVLAAMNSEEVADWAREASSRVRLRRAGRNVRELREGLRMIEADGRGETEAADRQRARLEAAEKELAQAEARRADAVQPAGGVDEVSMARSVAVDRVERQMSEETARLADTLDAVELEDRTRRLRRLNQIARIAAQFAAERRDRGQPGPPAEPADPAVRTDPTVVPPERAPADDLGPADELGPAEESLGEESSMPPRDLDGPAVPGARPE